MNNSLVLDPDAFQLPALLVGHLPTGKLPPRALSSGRLEVELRSIYL